MNPIPSDNTITAAGEYEFPPTQPPRPVTLELCGDLGEATVTPGFKGQDGFFTPFKDSSGADIVAQERSAWRLEPVLSGVFAIKVEGTPPSLKAYVS